MNHLIKKLKLNVNAIYRFICKSLHLLKIYPSKMIILLNNALIVHYILWHVTFNGILSKNEWMNKWKIDSVNINGILSNIHKYYKE